MDYESWTVLCLNLRHRYLNLLSLVKSFVFLKPGITILISTRGHTRGGKSLETHLAWDLGIPSTHTCTIYSLPPLPFSTAFPNMYSNKLINLQFTWLIFVIAILVAAETTCLVIILNSHKVFPSHPTRHMPLKLGAKHILQTKAF